MCLTLDFTGGRVLTFLCGSEVRGRSISDGSAVNSIGGGAACDRCGGGAGRPYHRVYRALGFRRPSNHFGGMFFASHSL